MKIKACLAVLLLTTAAPHAPAAEPQENAATIAITRCKMYAAGAHDTPVDCTQAVKRACAGKPTCEVGIGANLTDGRPQSEDAQVLIAYTCGSQSGEAGPHQFNDHATATLTCGFTD